MKKIKILYLVIAACSFSPPALTAKEPVPCLIFSGDSDQECVFDLSKFNRITFGEYSMTVSNSDDPASQTELLYSDVFRIAIDNRELDGLDEVSTSDETSFIYDRAVDALRLTSTNEVSYTVGIFNTDGVMLCYTTMRSGESVSLEALVPGLYIAVAAGNNDIQKIKFIK